MATITQLLDLAAVYMGRTTSADFNPSSLTPPGPNIDLGMYAFNAARRTLEQSHDFKYSETNVFLSIGSTGGALTDAYIDSSVTVTGTLSPNVAGAFARTGTYNSLPFYTRTVSSVVYFLSYSGTAWTITPGGFTVGASYWGLTTASSSPAGSYTAHTYTGTATVASVSGSISVKRIQTVALPVASSGYQPIEFLTNDEWLGRLKRQIGRTPYDASMTLAQLGVATRNPLAYQNGQTVYLYPEDLALPIVAQLNCVRWMPDYTTGSDTDFFTTYGPEALRWFAILELNKMWRRYVDKQESNVSEEAVKALADEARADLIAWDISTCRGTSTPKAQSPTEES